MHQCLPVFPIGNFIFPPPVLIGAASIRKYITKLNIPPILKPEFREKNYSCENNCINTKSFYIIKMVEEVHQLHPDIRPTKLWLYRGKNECRNTPVNPMIETEMFNPVTIRWENCLPTEHLLEQYIDHTLHGVTFHAPDVRNVVHMHGGAQSPTSDGGPNDWYTPDQFKIFEYPALEQPSMLFWHDHAIGITRLNVYAGLSGGIYIIRDEKTEVPLNLPKCKYEIPLVITDRTFDVNGQLVYSNINSSHHHPKWNTKFLGETICVNNGVWPYLEVYQNKYRFRIVNASDTRTYGLKLVYADDFNNSGPPFYQIGTDAGYLPAPVVLNDPNDADSPQLILAIAERADIIIDFSDFEVGTEFILINTGGPPPFPGGSPPDPETDGQVMKIIVVKSGKQPNFCIRTPNNFERLKIDDVLDLPRQLLLDTSNHGMTPPDALFLNNLEFHKPVSERPLVGATEIWEFINLTNGMHPIHVHLVDFQLINRYNFDTVAYLAELIAANPDMEPGQGIRNPVDVTPFLIEPPISPIGTNEEGWKDVIQATGRQVTRIIMKFAPRTKSEKYPFDPTIGPYMWHCHILSHEDNDMMRPFQLYYSIDD